MLRLILNWFTKKKLKLYCEDSLCQLVPKQLRETKPTLAPNAFNCKMIVALRSRYLDNTALSVKKITKMWIIFVAPWCSGYHCCTTSFTNAWTQVLRRLKPWSRWWGFWQFPRLEIRLNAFRLSTIAQNQFIIIIIIIIILNVKVPHESKSLNKLEKNLKMNV